ncbi:sodium/hydrogen exchanger 8 isoform X1 [Canis lupus familiaris]|uniref:sodium/hydrogen exchanger 8 isoform X1 n=1 Tax=Canis lupus familiaris TaxID=9615 RepID=UPI0018F7D840|nr:sodium/hydrogen exchanger 8 isoform X1 [Canis lupus familiaris]
MGEKMAEEEPWAHSSEGGRPGAALRFPNTTHEGFNVTLHTTLVVTTKLVLPTPAKPILPVQTGEQAQQEEQSSGMTIFFSLLVLAICIILVHLLIRYRLHFLPESVAVVSLGILMGAVIKIIEFKKLANWKGRGIISLHKGCSDVSDVEKVTPHSTWLCIRWGAREDSQVTSLPNQVGGLLQRIRRVQRARGGVYAFIDWTSFPKQSSYFYSFQQGNFFQNIGSITLFAVFGTAISAFVVGGGIYFLGQADVISKLNMTDSFAFGSLISAVDPVATIAIFNALHVDPVLNMLVFGESILNDAVSIVLTNTAEGLTRKNMSDVSGWQTFLQALGYFLKMFFGSAALGTLTGLISALVLKHIDLRKTPSLEFGMMIIFAYLPYGLAEGISLSGIMAILFSGIVMSHYTHHNLSPVTQILMQQTLRTVAFLCETCVFAFLGLSIFSFPHKFEISFVIWCIVLVLFGRAVNIFPLSYLLNFFRDHKITPKMMFIMWFSGLRGAIPYALSLHLDLEPMEKRQLIGTTTIIIVLFTILLLGGSTMPLIRLMDIEDAKARRRNKKDVNLSKTEKMGNTIESEHLSELTEEEYEAHYIRRQDLKGFVWLDAKYLNPFFTRRLTQEDLHHGRIQMKTLTNKWYEEVRQGPSGSEDDEQELL